MLPNLYSFHFPGKLWNGGNYYTDIRLSLKELAGSGNAHIAESMKISLIIRGPLWSVAVCEVCWTDQQLSGGSRLRVRAWLVAAVMVTSLQRCMTAWLHDCLVCAAMLPTLGGSVDLASWHSVLEHMLHEAGSQQLSSLLTFMSLEKLSLGPVSITSDTEEVVWCPQPGNGVERGIKWPDV